MLNFLYKLCTKMYLLGIKILCLYSGNLWYNEFVQSYELMIILEFLECGNGDDEAW